MDTINESVISSRDRIRACNSRKPQCELCLRSGIICTYPRVSLKPGPKRGMRIGQHSVGNPHSRARLTSPSQTVVNKNEVGDTSRLALSHSPENPIVLKLHNEPISQNRQSSTSEPDNDMGNLLFSRINNPITPATTLAQSTQSESLLPPTDLINHLVDMFFVAIQPQFRLLHQPTFVERLQSRAFISQKNSTLLLNAIFALSARYSDDLEVHLFDQSLALEYDSSRCRTMKRWERGKGFARRANELFEKEVAEAERFELESGEVKIPPISLVQAAALLAFAELGMGPSSRAHSLISTAVRMAYDSDLNATDQAEYHNSFKMTTESVPTETEWIRKEELRRAWWCIWELEIFVCTAKSKPRMINSKKCWTKLPVDDKDWFAGHQVPSCFFPGSLHRLRESLEVSSYTSVFANRIVACHLVSALVGMADIQSLDGSHDSLSTIEECAAAWKNNLADELKPSYACSRFSDSPILLGKARMFKGATPTTILTYCQEFSEQHLYCSGLEGRSPARSPGGQAFFEALVASDTICAIVRDWPTHYIRRSSPFIVCGLWAPACIQLLVKTFAGSAWDLAEKTSLSLRILTMAMEQLAEYWGIARLILSSFRKYEQKLTNTDYSDAEESGEDLLAIKWVMSLPNNVDRAFMATKNTWIYGPSPTTDILLGAGLETRSSLAHIDENSWASEPGNVLGYDLEIIRSEEEIEDFSWIDGVLGLEEEIQ
ncbi:hypothetical protein B7463_g7830, partial [Scytalidium lignicola]